MKFGRGWQACKLVRASICQTVEMQLAKSSWRPRVPRTCLCISHSYIDTFICLYIYVYIHTLVNVNTSVHACIWICRHISIDVTYPYMLRSLTISVGQSLECFFCFFSLLFFGVALDAMVIAGCTSPPLDPPLSPVGCWMLIA